MAQDGSNNPQTPVYSKARPIINEGCINCGQTNNQDFYNPGASGGKNAEVLAGDQIAVDDLSDSGTDRFRVNVALDTPLEVTLQLTARIASIAEPQPVLKGKTIDEILAEWSYNVDVVSQTLTNDGGVAEPALSNTDRLDNPTGLVITDDIAFTIAGDTGQGGDGATDNDTKSITFGNYLAYGKGVSLNNIALASAQTYFDGFITAEQEEIRTNRLTSVFALGGSNEKFFIIYPAAWGLGTFTKGIFTGGFTRMKNVAGVLKATLDGGDVESDILLDNGTGFIEAYYVYESLFDNQEDAVTPIIIS